MLINKIDFKINNIPTHSGFASNVPAQKPALPQNSDALQKQMHFMGLANSPIINPFSKTIEKQIAPILNKYFAKLNNLRVTDATILYKNEYRTNLQLIILDTPAIFSEGLEILRKNIESPPKSFSYKLHLYDFCFDDYQKIIQITPELQKMSIKGILGQGLSSTAFLNSEDEIIKLSYNPLFPSEKHFVQGVEIPITDRYIAKISDESTIYGVKEAFAESAYIRDISLEEYNKIWDDFSEKLRQKNPKYKFCDFERNNLDYRMQLGFVGDIPYVVDHECIGGRLLVGEK